MSDTLEKLEFNQNLVHQLIVTYQANARAWTKKTKSRSDVSGGGKKPWRQKGTGRARAGTRSSPIWRGGGVTFAHQPIKRELKLNRKMYRKAMLCILAEIKRKGTLKEIDTIKLKSHKTKDFLDHFKKMDLKKTLLIVDQIDENLLRSTGNLYYINLMTASEVDPISLCNASQVLVEKNAYKKLVERFSHD